MISASPQEVKELLGIEPRPWEAIVLDKLEMHLKHAKLHCYEDAAYWAYDSVLDELNDLKGEYGGS